jgi:hypothetical protein
MAQPPSSASQGGSWCHVTGSDSGGFPPLVGNGFIAKGWSVRLTLTAVNKGRSPGHAAARRQPFTVLLRGPADDILPEGLHDLSVANCPAFTLYIIPVHTPARDRRDYQVVFN